MERGFPAACRSSPPIVELVVVPGTQSVDTAEPQGDVSRDRRRLRTRVGWLPKYWIVVGSLMELLAVAGAERRWKFSWVALLAVNGVIAISSGYAGVPARLLPRRYRIFQMLAALSLIPAVLLQPTELHAYCGTVPGGPHRIQLTTADSPAGVVGVVYDYGDGSSFTGTSLLGPGILHSYARPGSYHLRLTVVTHGRPLTDACDVTVK